MKPTFTAAGHSFDTQEVYDGWLSYTGAENIDCKSVKGELPPTIKDPSIIKKHQKLFKNFTDIAKKFDLPQQPSLHLSNYGYPVVAATSNCSVILDSSMLKLLEPNEINACFAHEFAHLELSHKGKGDAHDEEFAADKLAAERTGDPRGLSTALQKMEEFDIALKNSSLRYKLCIAPDKLVSNIYKAVKGKNISHPEMLQRVNMLEKMEQSFVGREKSKADSQRTGP